MVGAAASGRGLHGSGVGRSEPSKAEGAQRTTIHDEVRPSRTAIDGGAVTAHSLCASGAAGVGLGMEYYTGTFPVRENSMKFPNTRVRGEPPHLTETDSRDPLVVGSADRQTNEILTTTAEIEIEIEVVPDLESPVRIESSNLAGTDVRRPAYTGVEECADLSVADKESELEASVASTSSPRRRLSDAQPSSVRSVAWLLLLACLAGGPCSGGRKETHPDAAGRGFGALCRSKPEGVPSAEGTGVTTPRFSRLPPLPPSSSPPPFVPSPIRLPPSPHSPQTNARQNAPPSEPSGLSSELLDATICSPTKPEEVTLGDFVPKQPGEVTLGKSAAAGSELEAEVAAAPPAAPRRRKYKAGGASSKAQLASARWLQNWWRRLRSSISVGLPLVGSNKL